MRMCEKELWDKRCRQESTNITSIPSRLTPCLKNKIIPGLKFIKIKSLLSQFSGIDPAMLAEWAKASVLIQVERPQRSQVQILLEVIK